VPFRVREADVPGIPDDAMTQVTKFADHPLKELAIPVIVDAILHLPTTDENIHSPDRNPQQPVSMVMDERKVVRVQFQDQKGNDYIDKGDVNWAANEFAAIRGKNSSPKDTANTIMHDEVGAQSMRGLKAVK
jgi:hypothetical protein